jgi:hypothetical protein
LADEGRGSFRLRDLQMCMGDGPRTDWQAEFLGMSSYKCFLLAAVILVSSNIHAFGQATWTQLVTAGGPSPGRDNPGAVYDPSSNRLMVFGGNAETTTCCTYLNDVWVLTNANGLGGTPTWAELAPAGPSGFPPGRNSLSVVYDQATNRMILFGGGQFGGSVYSTLFNDVWVLTNANGIGGTPTWMPLTPTGGPPPPRAGHEAVYDAQNNRMIIYGGGNNGIEDVPTDVWILTNANGLGGTPAWLQVSPGDGAPREEHYAAGYDPNTNRMIFFGGCCYWSNESWVLSNANGLDGDPAWLQLSPGGTLYNRPHINQVRENTKRSVRQSLYVPLSAFGCLGGVFRSAEYNNLFHFVHKLLHPAMTAPESCTLFTNSSQTVAHRKKVEIQCPGAPPPFPYK